MRITSIALAATLAAIFAGPALAADAENGQRIAERWCSACHVVSPDQTQASADVPSFAAIADTREPDTLKTFLKDPHPKMPDMGLATRDIDDIVAYIMSQKP